MLIPDAVRRLLWDIDPDTIDLEHHKNLLFERVMTRGTWEAMKWLRGTFSVEQIAAFVETEGARRLRPRDLAYWALIAGVEVPSRQGGGRPSWAGG